MAAVLPLEISERIRPADPPVRPPAGVDGILAAEGGDPKLTRISLGHRPGRTLWFALAVATVLAGLALRVAGARGDLWADEIWTLYLLRPLASAAEVVWKLPHDNNHLLNSLFLFAVGPDASPLWQRSLSITLGTASIGAAGLVFAPRRPEALAAMLLVAVLYPFVNYGSEARGYAGLILFSLLAVALVRRELERPNRHNRVALGATALLGLLSHFLMLVTVAVTAGWAAFATRRRTRSLRQALDLTLTTFMPAIAAMMALTLTLGLLWLPQRFVVGSVEPFSPARFVEGYGTLVRFCLGLPESIPAILCLIAAGAIGVSASALTGRNEPLRALFGLGTIGVPALFFLLRLPNPQISRYYLISGLFLVLGLASLFGRGWRGGGKSRVAAVLGLALVLVGNAGALAKFLSIGRGEPSAAVATMAASGGFSYASDQDFQTMLVVDHFGRRLGVESRLVPEEDWCRTPPDWLVTEGAENSAAPAILLGDNGTCSLRYERKRIFPAWGLSGRGWALFAPAGR